jgi:hypothetical protein
MEKTRLWISKTKLGPCYCHRFETVDHGHESGHRDAKFRQTFYFRTRQEQSCNLLHKMPPPPPQQELQPSRFCIQTVLACCTIRKNLAAIKGKLESLYHWCCVAKSLKISQLGHRDFSIQKSVEISVPTTAIVGNLHGPFAVIYTHCCSTALWSAYVCSLQVSSGRKYSYCRARNLHHAVHDSCLSSRSRTT